MRHASRHGPLRHGEVRSDGFIFWGYSVRKGYVREDWCSPSVFENHKERMRLRARRNIAIRSKTPELLRKHALDEARRRTDPAYVKRQTAHKLRWRRRKMNEPGFAMLCKLRCRLYKALKGASKASTTLELIGISRERLVSYIEQLWEPGMNWDNYGIGGWELDHKRPCAAFDLSKSEQQRACFHYTNLQPMWAWENHAKRHTV